MRIWAQDPDPIGILPTKQELGEDENYPPHNVLKHDVWTCFWVFWMEEQKASISQALESGCKKRHSLAGTFFQGIISGNCVKTQYYSWCFKGSHPLSRDTTRHTYSCRWESKQKCYVLAAATPAENISFHLIFCPAWGAGGGRHSPAAENSAFWGQSTENCTNLALL